MDKKRDREQELELPDAKKLKLDNSYLDTSFEIDDAFIEEVDKIERDCASTQRQAVDFSALFTTAAGKPVEINPRFLEEASRRLGAEFEAPLAITQPANKTVTASSTEQLEPGIFKFASGKAAPASNSSNQQRLQRILADLDLIDQEVSQSNTNDPPQPKDLLNSKAPMSGEPNVITSASGAGPATVPSKSANLQGDLAGDENTGQTNASTSNEPTLFTYASGKPVTTSSSSANNQRLQRILADLDAEDTQTKKPAPTEPSLFTYASGKPVAAPTNSSNNKRLQRILKDLEDTENPTTISSSSSEPSLFTYASGKPVTTPSTSANNQRLQRILADLDAEDPQVPKTTPTEPSLFTYASGKSVTTSPSSANNQRLQRILADLDAEDSQIKKPTSTEPSLFSYASGKSVAAPSNSANNKRLQRILADLANDEEEKIPTEATAVSDTSLFTYASGKPVTTTLNAAKDQRLQRILAELDGAEDTHPKKSPTNEPSLFTYASGKPVTSPTNPTNNKRLQRILKDLEDSEEPQTTKSSPTEPSLFTYASGKPVATSSSSANNQRLQRILADLDAEDPQIKTSTPTEPSLFTYASGKSVTTSSSSANNQRLQRILADLDAEDSQIKKPASTEPSLFTYASGKSVAVPSNSANNKRLQRILADLENDEEYQTHSDASSREQNFSTYGGGKKATANPKKPSSRATEMFDEEDELKQANSSTASQDMLLDLLAEQIEEDSPLSCSFTYSKDSEQRPLASTKEIQDLVEGVAEDDLLPLPDTATPPSRPTKFTYKTPPKSAPIVSVPTTEFDGNETSNSLQNTQVSTPLSFVGTPQIKNPHLTPPHRQRGYLTSTPNGKQATVIVSTPSSMKSAGPVPLVRGLRPPTPGKKLNFTPPRRVAITTPTSPSGSDTPISPRHKKLVGRDAAYARSPKVVMNEQRTPKRLRRGPLFNLDSSNDNRMTLKDLSIRGRKPGAHTADELKATMHPEIVNMTSDSAKTFVFKFLDENNVLQSFGLPEVKENLRHLGAGPEDVFKTTDEWEAWVENHYRWIVWKLAATQRSFPEEFEDYCHRGRVLRQLLYRYEREKRREQRPALRRALERDSSIRDHMVICIAAIRYIPPDLITNPNVKVSPAEDEHVRKVHQSKGGSMFAILEVTDGWYGVDAIVDHHLTKLVGSGAIFPGQKLHIAGAEILGTSEGISPLEISSASVFLRLTINGTRRAKWYEKMGFQRSRTFRVNLASIKTDGGNVPYIDVVIQRLYPVLTIETTQETRRILTRQGEQTAHQKFLNRVNRILSAKRKEVEQEAERQRAEAAARGRKLMARKKKFDWDEIDAETLYDLAMAAVDVNDFASHLPLVKQYELRDIMDKKAAEIQQELHRAQQDDPELKHDLKRFVRVLVIDYVPGLQPPQAPRLGKAMVTIWDPKEELLASLTEGSRVKMAVLSTRSAWSKKSASDAEKSDLDDEHIRNRARFIDTSVVHLNSTSMSAFVPCPLESQACFGYCPRRATPFNMLKHILPAAPSTTSSPPSKERKYTDRDFLMAGEFDGVGLIIHVTSRETISTPSTQKSRQCYFLVDSSCHIVAVHLVTYDDNFPPKAMMTVGSIVAFKNMTYKFTKDGATPLHICEASEQTEFFQSKVPSHLSSAKAELQHWLKKEDTALRIEELQWVAAKLCGADLPQ